MRTTIELPDELLKEVKSRAALGGLSIKEFFIEAIEQKLADRGTRVRRRPPAVGNPRGARIALTPEKIDEAMFG